MAQSLNTCYEAVTGLFSHCLSSFISLSEGLNATDVMVPSGEESVCFKQVKHPTPFWLTFSATQRPKQELNPFMHPEVQKAILKAPFSPQQVMSTATALKADSHTREIHLPRGFAMFSPICQMMFSD